MAVYAVVHLPPTKAFPEGHEVTGEIGRCRACHAEVVFVPMPSGKTPPYNRDGISHFATCPAATRFRGTAKKREIAPLEQRREFIADQKRRIAEAERQDE